jgi:creatinine amidohydrolase
MVQKDTMKLHLYEELHPDELQKIIQELGIVFLPLGTLEWHDEHLPFGLDALVAYEICKEVCRNVGGCVIPPLYFGTDREHNINGKIFHGMDAPAKRILPGSIYFMNQKLFDELISQIAKNIALQGFKKLVIVSGHSGTAQHNSLLNLAKKRFYHLKIYAYPGKLWPGGIDHAGKIETELMLYVNQELVHRNKLINPNEILTGEDPRSATKAAGKKRFEAIVKYISQEIVK